MIFGLMMNAGAADWQTTSQGKKAVEFRPEGLEKGAPWVQFWKDKYPDNEAKPLEVKLDPAKENAVCNGLDDDQNGKIDENCGLKTGALQATMSWDSHADVDLQIVYSPWDNSSHRYSSGMTFVTHGYGNEPIPEDRVGEGRDAPMLKIPENKRGSCSCNMRIVNGEISSMREGCKQEGDVVWAEREQYVENAFVDTTDKLPSGIYSFSFYNFKSCKVAGSRGDDIRANLAITVDGKLVGHFQTGKLGYQNTGFPILHLYVP